jgi:hypothetical protein
MSALCISVLSGSPSIRPWVSSPRAVIVGTSRQVVTRRSPVTELWRETCSIHHVTSESRLSCRATKLSRSISRDSNVRLESTDEVLDSFQQLNSLFTFNFISTAWIWISLLTSI